MAERDSHRQINTELSAEMCTQCHILSQKIDVNNAGVMLAVMCAQLNTKQVSYLILYFNNNETQIETIQKY